MKKINSINSIFLIALIIFMSFFSGCGGGGGGAQTAPGDATASGPSITLEGEIDPISLGIDASSLSPSGDLSQFSIIVLENKSYLDFQRGLAAETASSMNGPAYAPSYQQAGDFVRLVNSGAVIASSDKLNAANGKLNYSINVAINDNAPDATLALVEKSTGIAMLSAPLGCLPDKSFFTSDSSVPSAGEVSRAINYGFTNLLINDFELNSRTTVLSMANIENKISSNVNFFSSAAKKIISQDTSKNPVFSSKNSSITNISTVQKVVGSWFKDSTSVDQFSKAVTTVNTVFNSSIVSKDNKKPLASLLKSKTSFLGGTLSCFTGCVKNDSIIKIVPNLTTSINISGMVINSRSTNKIIDSVQSKFTAVPVSNPPKITAVSVSPSSAAAGETITLSIKSDMALAALPVVYMFGRKAAVYKISDSEYAARADVEQADKDFSFSIEKVIGINGKTSQQIIRTTTDSSKVVILRSSSVAAPIAEPPAGTYEEAVKVGLVTKTPGAFIRYTTDGSMPSVSAGTVYQKEFLVDSNAVINAVAVLNGSQSSVMKASYRIMAPPPKVFAPRFNIAGGSYNRAQTVAISTATPGASIRYTLDGSVPAITVGNLYSEPILIKESAELNAVAFAVDMADSSVTTAYYDIDNSPLERVSAPVIRPAAGIYDKPQAVSISCATPGASIRYTLDGSVPSFSEGALYSSSFMLGKNTVINAIAFKDGMADSDISREVFEITGEVSIDTPSALSEIEPKIDGTAVNADFDLTVKAASGWRLTAAFSGVNVLNGAASVPAVNNLAVLPVNISKLIEGRTCEIKITAVGLAGDSKGELIVRVKKDTVAPRREKLSAVSSNAGGPSIAELGDRIVVSLSTDEPVKNLSASIMNKPVTIRNTDSRNWTIARYLDGSEDSVDFDFIVNFTDLAGNSVSYPLSKKDINEGEIPVIKKGPGNSSFNIFRKNGVNKLYLSAVPDAMEYCLDGVSEKTPVTWYSGAGADVDLSGISGVKYIFVRQKGISTSVQCLGKIIAAPAYGIDELKSNNRWAFDASSGSVILTNFNDGLNDLDESMFSIHIYSGSSTGDGTPVMQYYMDKVEPGYTGKVAVPSFIKSSWTGGEFVSFYLKSNNGTPYITEDDVYIQPAAGVSVKPAPLNSAAAGDMNFIYDGRSNQIVFQSGATAMSEITPLVSIAGKEIVRLNKPTVSGASRSYELPFQPSAWGEISIALEYKDGSVSGAAKFTVVEAPGNMAEGFGNFSVKALLGQIAVTNLDSGRDGYTAFASTDNGSSWKELGKISANVGQNFNITMTATSKIKLAMRDKNGNFSLTQQEGVSLLRAPVNAASGDKAFLILGHEKKLEVDNSNGSLNGFNLLYSLDGGAGWSSTEAVAGDGRQKISLPEFLRSGSEIKIALLEWKTGNASFASAGYVLKSANNITSGAAAGDYTVNAGMKKVSVNNADNLLNGNLVYINGMQAGKIGPDENTFSYLPGSSDEVELYYADLSGNTWLVSKSKPVLRPRNNKLADGDFFVNAFNGKITFKNSGGAVSGLTPLISTDGGLIWKDIGPALTAGDKEFSLTVNQGDKIAAVFMDSEGNTSSVSEVYNAAGPKLNSPVKMILAGDGGAGAKPGVIEESGKPAVTIRPGVTLKNGESIKVTLSNGGAVTMAARALIDGAAPVFGGTTPGVTYEAGAAGNGSITTGSFNLNNPGGTPVSIIGTVEVSAVHSDILGNVSPASKAYIAADIAPPVWVSGYPAVSAPAYFKLNAGLRINEDGKIYLVCLKSSEAAPTAAQIKAGQNASGAAVAAGMKAALDFTFDGGAVIREFTGLANNTEYSVYAVAEDLYENLQAQAAVVKMKTLNNISPVWASGYPKAAAPDFNKLSASVKMNETGSVYLACLKSGAAALSAAQVKAGADASGSALSASMKAVITMTAADSEAVHIFVGLESAVEYDIYAVAEDEYGESQANPTVVKIKTIDDLPPVWSSGYPQGQPTGYTSLRLSASVDKKSIVYAVCLSSNAPEPTVAQVIAGKNASDVELASNFKGTVEVAANTTGYINFANLGVGTPYDIYSAAVNEYGVAQTAVTKTRAYTIALVPPSVSSVETSADGTKILVKFNKTISSTLPAAPGGFTVTLGSSYNDAVTGVALNADDKSIVELTLTKTIYSDISSIKIAYTRGDSGVRCVEGLELSNFSARAVTNESNVAFPLAKFEIAASSPQKTGVEFAITVTAKDAGGNTVSLYDSSVYESATAVGLTNTTTSISPTITGNFTNGAWTGNVKISKAKNGDTITASKGAITTSVPPSFKVGLSPVAGLITSVGNAQVTLNWTNPADTVFTDIKISYTGPSSANMTTGNNTDTSKTITGLTNDGAAYTFTITTTDGTNDSVAVSKLATPTAGTIFSGNAVGLIKDASISGSEMILTPSIGAKNGVAVFKDKVDVTQNFTVNYTFDISAPFGGGADGIIFMVTSHSPSELAGYTPPGNGWLTSYINNCFYVEFDTYRNAPYDSQAHSISIKYPADQQAALGHSSLQSQQMAKKATWNPINTTTEFQGTHNVKTTYNASNGEWKIYYDDMTTAKITYTYKLSTSGITLVDGKYLYVGVSAATGGSWEKHSLTNLTISN